MPDNEGPLLSIIVINFGKKEHLPRLISSLEKSEFKDFELIVGSIGSNAEKGAFSSNGLRNSVIKIKLVELDKNYGAPENRNILASHASGKYLMFLDNDTEILEDTLEKAISFIS